MKTSTVIIKPIEGYPALNMKMDNQVTTIDMQYAYIEIETYLDTIYDPIFVIVDLTENEQLPFQATVSGALFGPYANLKIRQWLVVGEHTMGKNIAKHLRRFTSKDRVLWLDNCNECLAYIEQESPERVKLVG